MNRPAILSVFLIVLGGLWNSRAQTMNSRVVDAKTGEPIPYATIQYGENRGIITNDEGEFSLYLATSAMPDSLYISSMGYEKTAVPAQNVLDSIISINPKPIELSEVYLFDKELDVDEIIDRVKENLAQNYSQDPIKQRLFYRKSSLDRLRKFDVEFKESTIEEFNKPFLDSVLSVLPKGNAYYTESLCDFYMEGDSSRLKIEKAAELYDKDNEVSVEAIGERKGVPAFAVYIGYAIKLFGGLAVIVGFQTRIAALLLVLFTLGTAFIFHGDFGSVFWKEISMIGGLLLVAAYGPGELSVDGRKSAGD